MTPFETQEPKDPNKKEVPDLSWLLKETGQEDPPKNNSFSWLTRKRILIGLGLLVGIIILVFMLQSNNFYLTEKNQKSTAGLEKVEADGLIYYGDTAPLENYGDSLLIPSSRDPLTKISITKLEPDFKLNYITEEDIKKYYSVSSDPSVTTFYNDNYKFGLGLESGTSFLYFKDISVSTEKLRDVQIKRVKLTAYEQLLTHEDEMEIDVEMAYLPLETGYVLVAIARNHGSTELDKTFEQICNTIYADTKADTQNPF